MTGGRVLSIQTCISLSSSGMFIIFQLMLPALHMFQPRTNTLVNFYFMQIIWTSRTGSHQPGNLSQINKQWRQSGPAWPETETTQWTSRSDQAHWGQICKLRLRECQQAWTAGLCLWGNNWILSALYAGWEYKYLSRHSSQHSHIYYTGQSAQVFIGRIIFLII